MPSQRIFFIEEKKITIFYYSCTCLQEKNSAALVHRFLSWARICKRLWSPGIDSEESTAPGYVVWRAGTTNRVAVPARQAGIYSWASQKTHKYRLRKPMSLLNTQLLKELSVAQWVSDSMVHIEPKDMCSNNFCPSLLQKKWVRLLLPVCFFVRQFIQGWHDYELTFPVLYSTLKSWNYHTDGSLNVIDFFRIFVISQPGNTTFNRYSIGTAQFQQQQFAWFFHCTITWLYCIAMLTSTVDNISPQFRWKNLRTMIFCFVITP